jgi:hypothetical protein
MIYKLIIYNYHLVTYHNLMEIYIYIMINHCNFYDKKITIYELSLINVDLITLIYRLVNDFIWL